MSSFVRFRVSLTSPSVTSSTNGVVTMFAQRRERLAILLELRRLYRDILHASAVLETPEPIYQPPPPPATGISSPPSAVSGASEASTTLPSTSSDDDESEREIIEQERKEQALSLVADMQLTSDLLRASLRTISPGFGSVFGPERAEECEQAVRDTARNLAAQLLERSAKELPLLPFGGAQQAQDLVDAKNARFTRRGSGSVSESGMPSSSDSGGGQQSSPSSSAIERFEAAEKV